MTRDEVKAVLERGECVEYLSWVFYSTYMFCDAEDCDCADSYQTIEEALDSVEFYCGGQWHEVTV